MFDDAGHGEITAAMVQMALAEGGEMTKKATLTVDVPDDIAARFNRAFANDDKDLIVTHLLEQAIARAGLFSGTTTGLLTMPILSAFYGIIIRMYFFDNQQHHLPHIHAEYQGNKAVFAIESADLIQGPLPRKQLRLVQAWMELRRDELTADWQLAVNGEEPVKIAPLN